MCLPLHHKSPKYFLTLVLMMTWIFASEPIYSQSLFEPEPFTIVLDPGHDAKNGGAMSATGTMEVLYNERLTEVIKTELETISQVKVAVTRSPGEVVGLQGRAETANEMEANLFISVHHDSVQTKYLKERNIPGRFETAVPIQGFSIFVSRLNGEYDKSLEFARLFGKELRRTKRSPSLHHAEKIKGENRPLLDPDLGVYQFDELIVLRETKMPAILFEAGVIVDAEDEQFVSDEENMKQTAIALKKAVTAYLETPSGKDR